VITNWGNVKTAILGGGLTGITLARLLQEKGEEVIILEREPDYGGLCRSRVNSGFTFDRGGSHIIFSRDAEVLTFIRDVLGENSQQNRRNTKIFYKGQYIKYPFENGLYQLPKEDLFFCINEFIKTMIAVEKGELEPPTNFREWITYTFGKLGRRANSPSPRGGRDKISYRYRDRRVHPPGSFQLSKKRRDRSINQGDCPAHQRKNTHRVSHIFYQGERQNVYY
jgi:hypothetical protein